MLRMIAFVICAAIPGTALAQDDYSAPKLKVGQTVYVTDPRGR